MSSRSSVDRAPARCSGGHGFDSCRGLRYFSLSHARVIDDYFIFHNYIITTQAHEKDSCILLMSHEFLRLCKPCSYKLTSSVE